MLGTAAIVFLGGFGLFVINTLSSFLKRKKNFLSGPVPYPHVSSQTSHQQTGNNGVNRNNAEQQLLDIEGKKERDESLMLQKQQKADALPALPVILQKQPLCSRRAFQLF